MGESTFCQKIEFFSFGQDHAASSTDCACSERGTRVWSTYRGTEAPIVRSPCPKSQTDGHISTSLRKGRSCACTPVRSRGQEGSLRWIRRLDRFSQSDCWGTRRHSSWMNLLRSANWSSLWPLQLKTIAPWICSALASLARSCAWKSSLSIDLLECEVQPAPGNQSFRVARSFPLSLGQL